MRQAILLVGLVMLLIAAWLGRHNAAWVVGVVGLMLALLALGWGILLT